MPGFLAKLLGTSDAVKATSQPIEAIGNVLNKMFTSKEEKLNHNEIMARIAQKPSEAQIELNKLEAQHRSVFVAGWRPFIGWVCGVSIAFYFIPQFALGAYIWTVKCLEASTILPYPDAGSKSLFELVTALLGLALLRTGEKFAKVAK